MKMEISLDHIDYQILRIMQENARTNNADIARELGMAPSAILERVKKLEQNQSYRLRTKPIVFRFYKDKRHYRTTRNRPVIGRYSRSARGS
jgi:Mn-dependent DtxR family transcriptional regulator